MAIYLRQEGHTIRIEVGQLVFKFTRQYPVFGRITNDQWNWLCDNVSLPQVEWTVSKGAVWFKQEQHKVLYLLKWAK